MRPVRMTAKRLGMLGAAVLMAGGGLLGTAVAASAGTPTITFSPNTDIGANQGVLVAASGFTPHTKGGISQCEIGVPGEPTIADATTGQPAEPISCGPFQPIKTTAKGGLPNPTGYGIQSGFNGPPDNGNDSSGHDATADAAAYPCPPTAEQAAAGATCVLRYATATQSADMTINYNFKSTTTTTAPPAVGCTPASKTVTVSGATLTVNPATCLVGNEQVAVTGSGLKPGSLGTLLECNSDTTQPTVFLALANKAVPVSCSTLTTYLLTTHTDGSLPPTTFTIIQGTTGPPGAGTDSAGVDGATDAAKFPCNQNTSCTLAFADQAGDLVTVPLSFGGGAALPPPTKAGGSTTTTPATKPATTKASTGKLAFTGAGPGLWVMGFVGLALILLGGSLLVLVDAPRRMLLVALRRGNRSSGPRT